MALKIILQGRKGPNVPFFCDFDTYCPFIQNLLSNFFLYFGMELLRHGANEL